MNLNLFLASRFFRASGSDRERRASALAVRIATAGVALGLAVMLVATAVVRGFQSEVRAKLTGFTAHAEVVDMNAFSSPESFPVRIPAQLDKELRSLPGVVRTEHVSLKMGLMKTDAAFQTIILKGVPADYDLTFLKSAIVEGRAPNLSSQKDETEVLISKRQATALGLKVGSRVFTYFLGDEIRLRRFTVSGIYETHLSAFDDYFVWTNQRVVGELNGWDSAACSSIEIYTRSFDDADATAAKASKLLSKHLGENAEVCALSVKDNPRTAGYTKWLELLDLNVLVVLALMMGVAGFTVVSGLLILILERTSTIGVLKALGASNRRIRHTFIVYALMIVVRGLIWGNAIALALIWAQQRWGFVRLDPDSYYVDAAPSELNAILILALNAATLIVCLLALLVPSFIIAKIRPSKSIRFE